MDAIVVALFATPLGFLFIFCPIFIVLFYRRRNIQPIKARPFVSTFVSHICVFIFITSICFKNLFPSHYPCVGEIIGNHYAQIFILNGMFLYVWHLWLRGTLTKQKLFFAESKAVSWLLRHQHSFTAANIYKFYLVTSFLAIFVHFVPWVIFLGNGTYQHSSPCTTNDFLRNYITVPVAAIFSVALFISAWKVRHVQDGFYMKRELVVVSTICFAGLTGLLIVLATGPHKMKVDDVIAVYLVSAGFGYSLISVVWKSVTTQNIRKKGTRTFWKNLLELKHISRARRRTRSHPSATISVSRSLRLLDILNSSNSKQLFHDHLVKEFSVENLMFYEAAQNFRKKLEHSRSNSTHRQYIVHEALNIYNQFIAVQAPLQVNLSATATRPIEENLTKCIQNFEGLKKSGFNIEESTVNVTGTIDLNVYHLAEKEVFLLMENDSFTRFIMPYTSV